MYFAKTVKITIVFDSLSKVTEYSGYTIGRKSTFDAAYWGKSTVLY